VPCSNQNVSSEHVWGLQHSHQHIRQQFRYVQASRHRIFQLSPAVIHIVGCHGYGRAVVARRDVVANWPCRWLPTRSVAGIEPPDPSGIWPSPQNPRTHVPRAVLHLENGHRGLADHMKISMEASHLLRPTQIGVLHPEPCTALRFCFEDGTSHLALCKDTPRICSSIARARHTQRISQSEAHEDYYATAATSISGAVSAQPGRAFLGGAKYFHARRQQAFRWSLHPRRQGSRWRRRRFR
jgi:hypothetical protein